MKEWLIYFFGSFFIHNQARQGNKHSLTNTILAIVLAIVILVCGLSWGFSIYFDRTFKADERFNGFVDHAFEQRGLSFTVQDGRATGDTFVNTFDNSADANYIYNGYNLIVDLRDTNNIFVDFSVSATHDGETISYEQFSALESDAQQNYQLSVTYAKDVVDVVANAEGYKTYLNGVDNDTIKQAYDSLDATADNYYQNLYSLYVQAKYYGLNLTVSGLVIPSLTDYYVQNYSNSKNANHLIILQTQCYCSFGGENGLNFVGTYDTLDGYSSTQGGQTFVAKSFQSSGKVYATMYTLSLLQSLGLAIVLWIALAIVLWLLCKSKRLTCGQTFGSCLQIVGSFILGTALLVALMSIVASLFTTNEVVYLLTVVAVYVMLTLRTVAFFICELAIPNDDKYLPDADKPAQTENEQEA